MNKIKALISSMTTLAMATAWFHPCYSKAAPPELIDAAGNTYTIWSEMTDYFDYGPTIYHSENTNALFKLDYEPVNDIAYVAPFYPNLSIYSALSNEEVTILEGYLHENYPEIRLQRKEEPTTYGEIELELIYDQDLTIEEQLMIAQDIKANTGLITAALSTTEAYALYVPKYVPTSAMNEDQLIDILATDSLQSEVVYTPIRPAQDNYVNDYSFDIYGGLVVLCSDPLLKEAQTFEVADTTVSMSAPDAYKEHFLGEFHELNPEFIIPAGMNVTADDLYVLSGIPAEKAPAIIPQILTDERFEVLGLFSVHYQRKAYYRDGWGTDLVITPEEGYTIDYNALNTEEYGYTVSVTDDAGERMGFVASAPATVEEAIALCEKLEAREDIAFAWPAGSVTADLPASDIQYMTIAPMTPAEIIPGDVNQDGAVDTVDAITTLQAYNKVSVIGEESGLTYNQNRSAEVDGDGIITTIDALEILKTYNANLQ